MADIKPKRKSAIQRGQVHSYDPNNFNPEPFFITTDDPDVILKNIKPYLGKYISVDTETHPLHMNSHEVPKGIVRRWVGKGKAAVPQDLPFCISISDGTQCFTMYDSLENGFKNIIALKPLLEDTSIEKIFHNYKFDGHELANIGVKIKGKLHDTVVLTKLVDENRPAFTLVTLARALPKCITLYEDMVDNYKKTHKIVDYRQIPRPLLSAYANADVWNCIHVFIDEYAKLEKDELVPLYTTELELMLCLFEMERVGMRVNLDYEKPLKEDLQKLMDDAEKEIYEEAGGLFNINSGKQLYNVLLKLGVDRTFIAMSDKGNPVLDKDALNDLAEKHGVSIVLKILEFRKYEKLLGTYAVGIYAQRDSVGRVHCSINQTEADLLPLKCNVA